MNPGYISALSALAGSAIGALASFATTWMTQSFQDRNQRVTQTVSRRERLYGDFIDEASRLFADALSNRLEDTSKFVGLYAIRSKLKLFAPHDVVREADGVMARIFEIYAMDLPDIRTVGNSDRDQLDVLRGFADACRADL